MRSARLVIVETALFAVAATCAGIVLMNPERAGGQADADAGFTATAEAEAYNPYAALPAYPAPFTEAQMQEMHAGVAAADRALQRTRAATRAQLRQTQALAADENAAPR